MPGSLSISQINKRNICIGDRNYLTTLPHISHISHGLYHTSQPILEFQFFHNYQIKLDEGYVRKFISFIKGFLEIIYVVNFNIFALILNIKVAKKHILLPI
jgi:hypothetical protein